MRIFLMRSLFYGVRTVTVEIPEDYDGSLSIETSNAKIGCSDLNGLTKIRLKTSNAKTSAVNLACAEFEARTSNAQSSLPTSLPGGDGRTIDVKTSNAPIDLKFESRD